MAQLSTLSNDLVQQRNRFVCTDSIRRRALARLYERRVAVDELIDSLERYQSAQSELRTPCVEITSGKK